MADGRTRRTLERIERLLAEHAALAPEFEAAQFREWQERARLAVAAVYGEPSAQLKRFDGISYSPAVAWSGMDRSLYAEARQNGVASARSQLQAIAEDISEHLAPAEVPGVDPSAMHPWVADAAGRLWQDGHRRQAVQAAAGAIEMWLRAKLEVHEGASASIVGTAFSTRPASEGSSRLRFDDVGPEGSDQWKSAHDGAAAFGRGCFMRIRNLYVHHDGESEQADLEALAALSLLARWVDEARVERTG